jgi:hypothetical protein
MKKILGTLALAGVIGLTACGPRDDDRVIIEDATIEQPAPAPTVIEPTGPAPTMTPDTVLLEDTLVADPVAP